MPHEIMGFLDRVRIAHSKEKAATPVGVKLSELPPVGGELSQESAGKSHLAGQGDSLSDSLLVRLIEIWPTLPDDLKGEIARLAGLQGDDVDDVNDMTATPDSETGAV